MFFYLIILMMLLINDCESLSRANKDFSSLEFPEKDDEWIRLSVMKPAEVLNRKAKEELTEKEISFLRNNHFGVYSVFEPWFNKSGFWKNQSYEGMLKSQHVNTIIGRDGKPYSGFTPAMYGLPLRDDIHPGYFRHEIVKNYTGWIEENGKYIPRKFSRALPVMVISLVVPDTIEPSQRLNQINRYHKEKVLKNKGYKTLREGINEPFFEIMNRPPINQDFIVDTIQFPDLELPYGVYNQIFENVTIHHYPTHRDQKVLISQMSKLMNKIRDLSEAINNNDKKLTDEVRSHALDLLEQYLYLGIHAHMFESVNFSLLMTQVNYILDQFGFQGIGPSKIDYIGLLEQFPEFRIAFREKLKETNPTEAIDQLQMLPIKTPLFSLVVHIQDFGDRKMYEGQIIKHPFSNKPKCIEEITFYSPLLNGIEIESKGRVQANKKDFSYEIPWNSNQSLGTRRQSRGLEEVAFRLKNNLNEPIPYIIHYKAKFWGESDWSREYKDGEVCKASGKELKPLTQLKIWLTEKKKNKRDNIR